MTGMIIRAAYEGVPIGTLHRIFNCGRDPVDIRFLLHKAVSDGVLIDMPAEDWPRGSTRAERSPCASQPVTVLPDHELILKMAHVLKTTKLEGNILLVVLRRGYASRDQLHDAVEANRGNPDEATDKKIVDVVVCKLRKKLAPWGLKLHTIHSQGYEMFIECRERAWKIINENGL
jgi:DNA-binding response OmpR family regulator